MKKTVLTAAFAALALSAAQAVNISWQQDSVTGNQTIGSFGDNTVFALTATLTVPGQEGDGKDLFRFGAGTGASTNYIKVAKNLDGNQSGILKFWAKGASGDQDSRETTATVGPNNAYSISMVVDQRNSTSKVTLYVGGNMVGELTLPHHHPCPQQRHAYQRLHLHRGRGRGHLRPRAALLRGWARGARADGAGAARAGRGRRGAPPPRGVSGTLSETRPPASAGGLVLTGAQLRGKAASKAARRRPGATWV